MDLEGIMLSEISQRKTNTILSQLYTESKKRTNTPFYEFCFMKHSFGVLSEKCIPI